MSYYSEQLDKLIDKLDDDSKEMFILKVVSYEYSGMRVEYIARKFNEYSDNLSDYSFRCLAYASTNVFFRDDQLTYLNSVVK